MTGHYTVPEHVQANINARHDARARSTQCTGQAGLCRRPATRRCARYGGSYCQACWDALPRTESPVPDPDRTLDALRATRGLQVLSIAETVLDTLARDSGKRVSGDRRRAARGEQARDQALAAVEQRTDEWTRRTVDDAIRELVRRGEPFSANTLREQLPPGIPGPLIGARFMAAHRAGLIRRVGDVPSTDPGTHGHRIGLWEAAA